MLQKGKKLDYGNGDIWEVMEVLRVYKTQLTGKVRVYVRIKDVNFGNIEKDSFFFDDLEDFIVD